MYGDSWESGRFMKSILFYFLYFYTFYNITQEPQDQIQENYYRVSVREIGKSGVVKYHQLLSKVMY